MCDKYYEDEYRDPAGKRNQIFLFVYQITDFLGWFIIFFWEVFCTIDVVLESVNHQGSNVSQVVACQKWTYREYMK